MIIENEVEIYSTLKEVFGYSQFRGNQEKIINNLLAGKNTFVIMPTGAGKSLCYQLPALIMPGTAIVISPLIALMKNQVDQLSGYGVNAQFLNSTLTKGEINTVKKETLKGNVRLLYVAPETLTKEENIEFLRQANISFVAIDEAHCISEWGHDFRPEYRKIRTIIEQLGSNIPVIALTATATPKVQLDIQKNLHMEEASLFKSSFNRKNLFYTIRPKGATKKALITFIKKHKGRSGIIYCLSRKKVEEIAELLRVNDINALPYHAGLDASVRIHNQDAFLNEDADVIVATIAFGMGIDKPDVRFVVHYDTPKSLEGYYQETGRAGRDGMDADCLMFYSYNDIIKLDKFNKDKNVTERDNAKQLLMEMAAYAESSVCRRKVILNYFGERLEEDCGFCDNCKNPKEQFEGKEHIELVIQTALLTEEKFGVQHMSQVVAGIDNEYAISYQHNQLPVFGKGREESVAFWGSIFRQAILSGFLDKDTDNYGIIKVTDRGRTFLKKPYSIALSKDHDYNKIENTTDSAEAGTKIGADEVLVEILKGLRKKVAKEKNVPPYVVLQEPSLIEMATFYPTNLDELSRINGVGMGKAQKFGKSFLEVIKQYVADNDITPSNEIVIKSSVNKSKIKVFIIQQVDRKIDLEEIAESKNIALQELMAEVEHICYSGTKLNLDYYIDQVVDADKQDDIYDYFMSAENDSISHAMNELGSDYTEEELRLMRIKFLSELAN
ncbi:MAG: DNA helicase RecQ [Cytophagaceae bacterium]|nr:DNA helicase RecQ [Cytophagaceae bacterium]